MSYRVFAVIAALAVSTVAQADWTDYWRGYQVGFNSGYCRAHNQPRGCASPAPPAPQAFLEMTYQAGYDEGFIDGADWGQ